MKWIKRILLYLLMTIAVCILSSLNIVLFTDGNPADGIPYGFGFIAGFIVARTWNHES